MKNGLAKIVPLLLAGALQIMPMARSVLPTLAQGAAPSGWAIIFRWVVGSAAYLGYHAISSASSIAISPPSAIVGQPYVGTVTYSGGHAGSVSSMQLTNVCLGSSTLLFAGLSIVYAGGNTATVTGTPTATNNYHFTLKIFDGSGCSGGGNNDTRSTTLVVGPNSSAGVAPTISAPPQSITAQIGADALFSAGASGTPTPSYFWYKGIPSPATLVSTNSLLDITAVKLADAGLYTVTVSNSSVSLPLPSASAYLSVVLTPGTNQLELNYTNYYPAGNALTMYSQIANVPAATNTYQWGFNFNTTGFPATSNLTLAAAQVMPAKTGPYSIIFNSTISSGKIVDAQQYYALWAFGYLPALTNEPSPITVNTGDTATFTIGTRGSLNVLTDGTTLIPTYTTNYNTPSVFWYKNGTTLVAVQTAILNPQTAATYASMVTNVSLVLPAVTPADAGSYTAVITNFWGSVTSSPAALTVNSSSTAPTISAQPSAQSVLAGQNASFSVIAGGSAPLTYQWQKGNANLSDGGIYSGVLTNVLKLTGVGTNNAGNYSVVITNATGATNSLAAPLTVALPPRLILGTSASGNVQLSALTGTGLLYVVQTTTNLTSSWVPVATNAVPGTGLLLFTNPTTGPVQFFRLQFP
jgi:Immunoglobulin domain